MNKKFLKHYMETNPEGTAQTYIFLVDNQDIALNIVMSGYQALCLVQEDDGYYFSADSFIEEMRAIQFTGSCQCAQGKFTESEHSKECVREVQRSSDSICAFIDESLVRAKGKRLKRSEVFNMYEEYCKENGRQGHGKSNFFRNMTDKGFLLKQYNGEFYYQDIAVKEEFCPVDSEERIPFEETDTDYKQLQLNMNQGIKGI